MKLRILLAGAVMGLGIPASALIAQKPAAAPRDWSRTVVQTPEGGFQMGNPKAFEAASALDPGKKVITYCGGGIAATWNAVLLNKLGQQNVAVNAGSMNEWASDPACPIVKSAK